MSVSIGVASFFLSKPLFWFISKFWVKDLTQKNDDTSSKFQTFTMNRAVVAFLSKTLIQFCSLFWLKDLKYKTDCASFLNQTLIQFCSYFWLRGLKPKTTVFSLSKTLIQFYSLFWLRGLKQKPDGASFLNQNSNSILFIFLT